MTKLIEMTDAEFRTILDGYFAPPSERRKMTDKEVLALAEFLNEKIDIPLIREPTEEKIWVKIVLKVDTFLYNHLPNELYDLIRSLDRGIDEEEAERLTARLSSLANKHIDIPYIPEAAEYMAIRFVIRVVINAARKGWNFEKAAADEQPRLAVAF